MLHQVQNRAGGIVAMDLIEDADAKFGLALAGRFGGGVFDRGFLEGRFPG